jgi:hypothetical protein
MDLFGMLAAGVGAIGLVAYLTKPSNESFNTMITKEGITGIPLVDKQLSLTMTNPVFVDWIFFKIVTIQLNERDCDFFGFFNQWIK